VPTPGTGGAIPVSTETRRHLEKVLRYPAGAPVSYTNGAGLLGVGTWNDGAVIRGEERQLPRPRALTVAVAPPNSNSRLRFAVEKLGELGIERLLWLRTEHGQARPPRSDKAEAWARAALEQSHGAWLMEVAGPVAVDELGDWGTPLFAERGGIGSQDLHDVPDPVLCIGPEGGWARGEIPSDAVRIGLGDSVLRVETAAIVGAALLLAKRGSA
jgi:16S rRNA (uracil1498-N3)-methyltransferase